MHSHKAADCKHLTDCTIFCLHEQWLVDSLTGLNGYEISVKAKNWGTGHRAPVIETQPLRFTHQSSCKECESGKS